MKWDTESGVRERLALLADLGPNLKEGYWGYHPSRDYWYPCGPGSRDMPDAHRRTLYREVNQEASESLRLIQERWGLDHEAALKRIAIEQIGGEGVAMTRKHATERLEHIRQQLRAECVSYEELAELESLVPFIDPEDAELLEAAGVPEFPDEDQA